MERTRKQKWLIGCLSTAGVLVVLGGLAVGGFLMFMKSLHTVPPKSTQIVLQNDTSERLRIDRILYGSEDVLHADSDVVLDVKIPGKFTWYRKDMIINQPEMTRDFDLVHRIDYGTTLDLRGNCQARIGQTVRIYDLSEARSG